MPQNLSPFGPPLPGQFRANVESSAPPPGQFRPGAEPPKCDRLNHTVHEIFNLVSNVRNGAGLERDCLILRSLLESQGKRVNLVQFTSRDEPPSADVNIFLEVVAPHVFQYGREQWFIPNSEYIWNADAIFGKFSKVLCKTNDAFDIWGAKSGNAIYTGFESSDLYRSDIKKQTEFLHLAGLSGTKNTEAVIAAWRDFELPYPLTVVSVKDYVAELCDGLPNVTFKRRVSDDELVELLNRCQFHLMPSEYEGWGHVIHEGLGCGAVMITTNAPPMNSYLGIHPNLLVSVSRSKRWGCAQLHSVDASAVADAITMAMELTDSERAEIGAHARQFFLNGRNEFRRKLSSLVNP